MNKRERVIKLDHVRVIAMLGVLMIHVTSTFVYAESKLLFFGMNPAFLLNQISRFAVPLFVLLSGLSLGFSRSNTSYKAFLRTRCVKIVLPYLFWSLVYLVLFHRGEPAGYYVRSLLWGTTESHLYFIIILIPLYLIYPLLKKAVDRYLGQALITSFLLSFFLQQAILYAGAGVIQTQLLSTLHMWELFPTWGFYFVLGMVIHKYGVEKLCRWAEGKRCFLIAAAVLYGLWYSYESFLTQSLDSVKIQLFVFTPLVLLAGLAVGHGSRNAVRFNRLISFLADRSLTVFFSHILILRLLRKIPVLVTGMKGMALLFLLETAVSVLFAWGFDNLLSRAKKLRRRSPGH